MVELQLQVPEHLVEPVSDALIGELEALSVSVEDADADTDAERPLFGEPGMPVPCGAWRRSGVKALFGDEQAATDAATLLLAQDWARDVHLTGLVPVAEQDWVRLTQAQFPPVEVSRGFWIVPSWHEPPPDAVTVIRLDPGQAFGTGTHPTTLMCLRWIALHVPAMVALGPRVLDYGCGSGILAIGAARHGAGDIDAVDIDPAAVEATRANAEANGAPLRCGLPELAEGDYWLVLANILAAPLKLLAPLLCGHVTPGGHLVLAGILERQADEVEAAYAPWIALRVADRLDGWILMTGQRPAQSGMA
jgi:ribosomal protein L11 methyltransferase